MVNRAQLLTQLNMLKRHPWGYLKTLWTDYLTKEPGAIWRFLVRSVGSLCRTEAGGLKPFGKGHNPD